MQEGRQTGVRIPEHVRSSTHVCAAWMPQRNAACACADGGMQEYGPTNAGGADALVTEMPTLDKCYGHAGARLGMHVLLHQPAPLLLGEALTPAGRLAGWRHV